MHIDPARPYADGILYDDLEGLPDELINRLSARGVIFATEFKHGGRTYCGRIIAVSMAAAEEIAFARDLGEEVTGVCCEQGDSRV